MVKFVFNNFVVATRGRKSSVSNIEIVQQNIRGLVIEDEGIIKVKIGDKTYNITEDSFDCKGKKEVWYQNGRDKYGHRIRIIRNDSNERKTMDKRFAPFSVGLPCWGDIIKMPLETKFRIKKCINPNIY